MLSYVYSIPCISDGTVSILAVGGNILTPSKCGWRQVIIEGLKQKATVQWTQLCLYSCDLFQNEAESRSKFS